MPVKRFVVEDAAGDLHPGDEGAMTSQSPPDYHVEDGPAGRRVVSAARFERLTSSLLSR
jgi:hypothetical protein